MSENNKIILITGGSGRLGKELIKIYPNSLHPSSATLDITNKDVVKHYLKTRRPDVIIHCAALTNVRECEENKEKALDINFNGVNNLLNVSEKYLKNVYFIYLSTACVFYGDKGDYTETDIPYPKNFYALTKFMSEIIIKKSHIKKSLIIRTNFVPREKWPYDKAFVDRFGTYLFADDLALAIKTVIEMNLTGLVHICGMEKLSMFDLASIITPEIKPMTLSEYIGPPVTIDMSLKSTILNPFKITRCARDFPESREQVARRLTPVEEG